MENKMNKWKKGQKVVASFLLASSLLMNTVPMVKAEDNKTQHTKTEVSQTPKEEILTPNIVRHEGRSRENVAEMVASSHFSKSNKVIIVNREKFPDAISATNISQGKYPVLYTREGKISESTIKLLKSMPLDEIYVLGGTLSVNDTVIKQLEKENNVKVTRVAGRSRYDANASAIEKNFTQANHVVIASGEVYSDALYGVSYANTVDSPVVLTKTNRLEPSTVELLEKLGVEQATIIGGSLTVTKEVENQLDTLGVKHSRIAGRNRYIGSAEVAAASYDNPENVVVASGEVFSDALVSAPLAQKLDAPILLVRNNRMEDVVESYLSDVRVGLENIYIQGGPITILPAIENKIENLTNYVIKNNVLPFETIEEEDETLLAGKKEIVQDGVEGLEEIYYNVIFDDAGKEVERKEFNRKTLDPVPQIIKIGTRVDIESISLSEKDLTLEERDNYQLTANILPENATNKKLKWASSNSEIVTVDENGVVSTHKAGEAIIQVADNTGKFTDEVTITVKEPTIDSIEDLTMNVIQHDEVVLPNTVTAVMSNDTTKEVPVSWETSGADTSVIGTKIYNGTVDGYQDSVKVSINVKKYNPQPHMGTSYSAVNGISRQIGVSLKNAGTKTIHLNKIEIYEEGNLHTTYTSENFNQTGISTIIEPGENWSITANFNSGIRIDNLYIKYYFTANNTEYEFESKKR